MSDHRCAVCNDKLMGDGATVNGFDLCPKCWAAIEVLARQTALCTTLTYWRALEKVVEALVNVLP